MLMIDGHVFYIFVSPHRALTEEMPEDTTGKALASRTQCRDVNVGIFFLLFPNSPRCCKQPTRKSCPEPGLFGRCYFSLYFSVKKYLAAAHESTCVLHLLILKTLLICC